MQYSESELNAGEELMSQEFDEVVTESVVEGSSIGQQAQLSQQQQQVCKESMQKPPTKLTASCNNTMNEAKKLYVLNMRKELCGGTHIVKNDGHLNLKYFNVKKG